MMLAQFAMIQRVPWSGVPEHPLQKTCALEYTHGSYPMTSTEPTRVERRCGQRFSHSVSVHLRVCGESRTGNGFTQDLSSRGALVWTDLPLVVGQTVEMSLVMPAVITLANDMDVRCHTRVVRVECTADAPREAVALQIEKYDFPQQVSMTGEHRSVPVTRV